jgi:hypothetical protein
MRRYGTRSDNYAVVKSTKPSIKTRARIEPGRYQIITAGGITELLDIKTNDVYYNYGTEWHRVSSNGTDAVVSELPK